MRQITHLNNLEDGTYDLTQGAAMVESGKNLISELQSSGGELGNLEKKMPLSEGFIHRFSLQIFKILIGNFNNTQKLIAISLLKNMNIWTLRLDEKLSVFEEKWYHDKWHAKLHSMKLSNGWTAASILIIVLFSFIMPSKDLETMQLVILIVCFGISLACAWNWLFLTFAPHIWTTIRRYRHLRFLPLVVIVVLIHYYNISTSYNYSGKLPFYGLAAAFIAASFALAPSVSHEILVFWVVMLFVITVGGASILYILFRESITPNGIIKYVILAGGYASGLMVGAIASYRVELQEKIILFVKNAKDIVQASQGVAHVSTQIRLSNTIIGNEPNRVDVESTDVSIGPNVPAPSPESPTNGHQQNSGHKQSIWVRKVLLSYEDVTLEAHFQKEFKNQAKDLFIPMSIFFSFGQIIMSLLDLFGWQMSLSSAFVPVCLIRIITTIIITATCVTLVYFEWNNCILFYYMFMNTMLFLLPLVVKLFVLETIDQVDEDPNTSEYLVDNMMSDMSQVAVLLLLNACSSGVIRFKDSLLLSLWTIIIALVSILLVGANPYESMLLFVFVFLALQMSQFLECLIREFIKVSFQSVRHPIIQT